MLTASIKSRRAVAVIAGSTVMSVAAFGGVSLAKTSLTRSKSATLLQRQTKTINVGYPQALKHKGAKYSCSVRVSGPAKSKVKILSKGSALGGSVCRVKAQNTSRVSGLDGTAKVTVTATTTF